MEDVKIRECCERSLQEVCLDIEKIVDNLKEGDTLEDVSMWIRDAISYYV